MTASLQSTGKTEVHFTIRLMIYSFIYFFYSQVNHKFEGRSVGEDSLRQMFAKSHAFIQSTSGCYVKWVWGVFGPQSPSPLSLMKSPARKTFISLPVLHFIKRGLSWVSRSVHVFLKDAENVEMWTWRCSFVIRVSNKLLVGRTGALHCLGPMIKHLNLPGNNFLVWFGLILIN